MFGSEKLLYKMLIATVKWKPQIVIKFNKISCLLWSYQSLKIELTNLGFNVDSNF